MNSPYTHFTITQLTNKNPYDQTTKLRKHVFTDIKNTTRKMLFTIEPTNSHVNAYSTIIQSESKTYSTFLKSTNTSCYKTVLKQTYPYIPKILTFTSTNEEYKKSYSNFT